MAYTYQDTSRTLDRKLVGNYYDEIYETILSKPYQFWRVDTSLPPMLFA